jgi:hypothetical protein
MSTGQVQAYARRLTNFTARANSYVPGMKGTPLSGSAWRQYKRAERTYNSKSDSYYESIKNLRIPTLNQTVSEYMADLRSSKRVGDYRTFGHLERENSLGITSQKSLQKLLKQMEKRADPNYLANEADLQRKILRKMLRRTSNKDAIPIINEMSDDELIAMTQYTDFMNRLEGSYAMSKSTSTDKPRWQSSVLEDNEEEINALIQWAHNHFVVPDKDEPTSVANAGTEQDTVDTRTGPQRDRYGRFVRQDAANPDPNFTRDSRGRFARKH